MSKRTWDELIAARNQQEAEYQESKQDPVPPIPEKKPKTLEELADEYYEGNPIYEFYKNKEKRHNGGCYDEPLPTGESATYKYIGTFGGAIQIMTTTGYEIVQYGNVYSVPYWVNRNLSQAPDEWQKIEE